MRSGGDSDRDMIQTGDRRIYVTLPHSTILESVVQTQESELQH